MKKLFALLLALLTLSVPAFGQSQTYGLAPVQRMQFFTNAGAPVASGFLCVYAAGTTTPATWYSDNSGTALPDPIRLNAAGIAQTGVSGAGVETGLYLSGLSYKVNLYASGTGNTCNGVAVGALIRTQDNVYDVGLINRTNFVANYATVAYASSVVFPADTTSIFKLTLTGNVASSSISTAPTGAVIEITICQDGTGGRTFAWPGTVVAPPIVNATASICTSSSFYFDGTFWRPWGLNGTQSATGFTFTGGVSVVSSTTTSGAVTFATSTTSSAYTVMMPPTAPAAGQSLQGTNQAGVMAWAYAPLQPPGGRLTTETGVPISTTDRTGQGTIYYTPYINNQIWLYTSSVWTLYAFPEESLALTATSGKNYDVFDYASGGVPTLELSAAWASDTARTDALALQNGVWVKSSDHSRLWLGTIRASGANVTADSIGGASSSVGGQGFVCNYYNAVRRPLKVIDTTATWSYTSATIRQANGATGNKVEAVVCQVGIEAEAVAIGKMNVYSNMTRTGNIGVGLDSTTTFSGLVTSANNEAATAIDATVTGSYAGYPGIGYHYLSWNESGLTAGGSVFYGSGNNTQSGLIAHTFR